MQLSEVKVWFWRTKSCFAVEAMVWVVVVVVCLIIFIAVAECRVYAGIFIAVALISFFKLWSFLPSHRQWREQQSRKLAEDLVVRWRTEPPSIQLPLVPEVTETVQRGPFDSVTTPMYYLDTNPSIPAPLRLDSYRGAIATSSGAHRDEQGSPLIGFPPLARFPAALPPPPPPPSPGSQPPLPPRSLSLPPSQCPPAYSPLSRPAIFPNRLQGLHPPRTWETMSCDINDVSWATYHAPRVVRGSDGSHYCHAQRQPEGELSDAPSLTRRIHSPSQGRPSERGLPCEVDPCAQPWWDAPGQTFHSCRDSRRRRCASSPSALATSHRCTRGSANEGCQRSRCRRSRSSNSLGHAVTGDRSSFVSPF